VREAWALFVLFAAQFALGGVLPAGLREWERLGVAFAYLVLAAGIILTSWTALRALFRDGLRTPVEELIGEPAVSVGPG
jgi:hypothetical protein